MEDHVDEGDALDGLVRDAVAAGGARRDLDQRLRGLPGVVAAEVRPGVVKTEPPLTELAVEYRPPDGPAVRRVYDLEEAPDGGARVVDSHPA